MNFNEISSTENTVLNPKLWEGSGRLKSTVRGALLRIAEDFRQYCEVDFPVIDIVITGSNVNYNYTGQSDLDLHLITDYDKVDCDQELEQLFDSKRLLYEQEFDIKIYGIPVTLYVEDRDRPGVSQGLFSVKNNSWIRRPQPVSFHTDPKTVEHWIRVWQTVIDAAEQTKDRTSAENVLYLLRKYRRLGLAQPGAEFGTENTVYKQLRNSDEVQRLTDLVRQLKSQELSVN